MHPDETFPTTFAWRFEQAVMGAVSNSLMQDAEIVHALAVPTGAIA
jgi:hypothetical protein